MNIIRTLSSMTAAAASIMALGSRMYQLFYGNSTALESSLQNRLLRSTLQNTSRTMRGETNSLSALGSAGLMVLTTYPTYALRQRAAANRANHQPRTNQANRGNNHRLTALPPATPSQNFEARLAAIHCKAPEEYNDPITLEVMENPVVAKTSCVNRGHEQITEHVYDRTTFDRLNGTCPENRLPFIEVKPHNTLKKTIADFVKRKEAEHQANSNKTKSKKKKRR